MSRPRLYVLLTALVLCLACTGTTASAFAAGSTRIAPATAPPAARTAAHPGTGHRAMHARASCGAARRHHRRHHRRCRKISRSVRAGHARSGGNHPSRAGVRHSQPGDHTQPQQTPQRHAKRARHGGEATTVVTVGPRSGAATIASVLATPCQNTEMTPEASNLAQAQAAALCLINQERARADELPLRPNAQLAEAALLHSEDMVKGDYFAHVSPSGETPLQRVEAGGYIPNSQVGYTVGENIAWGTLYLATPKSIVAAWMASPEHRANVLDGDYRDTAIAIAPSAPPSMAEGQAGAIYTQEFGVIEA